MVSDKVIKIEILISILFIFFLTIGCMGATYANFLAVDEGKENTISLGDLAITYCNDVNCNSTYENIGQVIGTKAENGVSTPNYIYPYENDSEALNTTPYIFKVENTGSLDSTVKIKLKEDATFTPSGDYSDYARLTSKYASHLKVAIRKKVLYDDTGYQLGDVNMDGIINLKDVNLIINSLSGIITLTDEQKILADFNEDGEISYLDALGLNDTLTGSETKHENSIIYIYTYTDLEDGVIFKDDIIKSGESAIYFLWLYLDDTTPNDAQKTYFVGNIDVDGEFIPKVNPVSFATDSWEIIVTAVKENNISKYNVGDTRKIDMGDYGTRTLRIANTSTPSECSTEGFSQTACGFVIEFADVITLHEMNDSSTNIGGWPASSMYTFVNTDIYNALPEELRDIIIDTVVVSSHGSEETTNFVSTDKLYLLAPTEIWSDWSNNCDTGMNTTRQLDYYKKQGVTTNNCSAAIKRSINDGNYWWLRAADFENNFSFFRVNTSGGWRYSYDSSSTDGVSPAFRIG